MMRKALSLVVAAAAVLAPAGARADGSCRLLSDPMRDVTLSGAHVDAGFSDAIDLTEVSMSAGDGILTARMSVRDVTVPDVPDTTGAIYEVSWYDAGRAVFARAERSGDAWRFYWFDDASGGADATGMVDRSTNAISIEVPNGTSGALEGVRAHTFELLRPRKFAASGRSDVAPNDGGGARFEPLGICASSLDGMGSMCTVLSSDSGEVVMPEDPATPSESIESGSTQIRAVRFAAATQAMIAEIAVEDLTDTPDGVDAQRWEVAWVNPRWHEEAEQQIAFAHRSGERVEFGVVRDGTTIATSGVIDDAAGIVRILVPRPDLRLLDGTRIDQVRAATFDVNGTALTARDSLPESGDAGTWVVGSTCDATEIQVCPVVVDRGGDARMLETGAPAPPSYGALDLRAAGARTDGDTVVLSARVSGLDSDVPPGADVIGWTVSWLDGDRRMYAQAERYASGDIFRYGARTADGIEPAGPTFAGTATSGSFDAAREIVEIVVPRWAMPADGTVLHGFGATAWALTGQHTGAVYLVWDATGARTYQAGASCGA